MTYHQDEFLPLSALSSFIFCHRRAALRYVNGIDMINHAMAEGIEIHSGIDKGLSGGRQVEQHFRVPVASKVLGISGILDVLEHDRTLDTWRPVEFKRGKVHEEASWAVQLCAQAMALEELLGIQVTDGDIFYAKSHRRKTIVFDSDLRHRTMAAAIELHELVQRSEMPIAVFGPKCHECAMYPACLPTVSDITFQEE